MNNTAFFNPTLPPSINLPPGFTASVFASGLNMPTGIAFLGNASSFQVFVLESGHGLPSVCNDETLWPGGEFDVNNPFTPDILVFNQNGKDPRPPGQTDLHRRRVPALGPAIDIAFVNGLPAGGCSRPIQPIDPSAQREQQQLAHRHREPDDRAVTPFITNLPTGDHPTEQLAFKGGWIYWSQGSTTNSGVVGLDNGGGQNQSDIPCQDITLSENVFVSASGGGVVHERLFPVRRATTRRDNKGVLQLVHGSGSAGGLRRRHSASAVE